tara:strand:- start:1943 stop:3679 length:1737 start_codon:yes stop_codon:yes gene_type:complete
MKIIETIEQILQNFLKFIKRGDYISNIKNNIVYLLDTFINTKKYFIPTIIILVFIIIYLFSYIYVPSGLKWKNMGRYDPEDISIKNKKQIFNSNLSNYLTDSNKEISTIPDEQFYYFELDNKTLTNVYIKSNHETPHYYIPISTPSNIILIITSLFVFIVLFFIFFLIYRREYYHIVKSQDSNTSQNSSTKVIKKIFYNKYTSDTEETEYQYQKADASEDFLYPLLEVYKRLAQISVLIILPFLIVYFILFMYNNFIETHTIIVLVLVILFTIILLAIVANVFKPLLDSSCELDNFYPTPKKDSGNPETSKSVQGETNDFNLLEKIIKFFKLILCIVLNLVFAIPCILLIFVEKLKDEIQITTPTTFLLLLIQIVIIFLIIIIPKLYNTAYHSLSNNILKDYNEKVKLNRTTQLSYQNTIGVHINKPKPRTITIADYSISLYFFGTGKSNPVKNPHNYSITFSIYIKPDNKNLFFEDKNIIDFCKQPQILFDPKNFELIVKSNDSEIYRTNYFKLQYFNNVKINYNNNNIDIYINDYLRYSNNHSYRNLGENNSNDIIKIGDENGIYGTIKNLYYENI